MEHANQLTYKNQNVNCRTVTLTGEDFNPRGVLTGGSRNTKASMLQTLFENSASHGRVVDIEQRIQAINGFGNNRNCRHLTFYVRGILEEFATMRPLAQRFEEWQHRLTEKRNRLNAVNEAIKLSPIEMLREEIAQLEAQITEASEVIQTDGREVEALGKRIRELEAQKKDEHYQAGGRESDSFHINSEMCL
jgi:chromosome segregation ATPase